MLASGTGLDCSPAVPGLVEFAAKEGAPREETLDIIRLMVEKTAGELVARSEAEQGDVLEQLLNMAASKKEQKSIKKVYKVLAATLRLKSPREYILKEHTHDFVALIEKYCKEPDCDAQWVGFHAFLRTLPQLCPLVPVDAVSISVHLASR